MLEAELEESSLGPADAFEQREQRNSLFALVPALEPPGQDADLVSEHHGEPEGQLCGERINNRDSLPCPGAAAATVLGSGVFKNKNNNNMDFKNNNNNKKKFLLCEAKGGFGFWTRLSA